MRKLLFFLFWKTHPHAKQDMKDPHPATSPSLDTEKENMKGIATLDSQLENMKDMAVLDSKQKSKENTAIIDFEWENKENIATQIKMDRIFGRNEEEFLQIVKDDARVRGEEILSPEEEDRAIMYYLRHTKRYR